MNKFAWIVVAALAATLAVGCTEKSSDKGGTAASGKTGGMVAVVDLQQLSTDLGVANQIDDVMKSAQKELVAAGQKEAEPLNLKAKTLVEKLNARTEVVAKSQPDAKSTDNQKALTILRKDADWAGLAQDFDDNNAKLKEIDTKYNQAYNKYVQETAKAWRDSLDPAMIAVAKEKGISILLPKNPQIVGQAGAVGVIAWNAADADITGDLTNYLKAHPVAPFKPLSVQSVMGK